MRRPIPCPRSGAVVRFLAVTAGLASGLLGGCRSPEAGSEPSADGPRAPVFELPEPARGMALIHVIRGDEGADSMDVKLTADLLGTIGSRDYVVAEVEPGNYVLGCFLTYIDRDPVHTFSTVRLTAGRAQYFLAKKVTSPPRPGAYAEEIAILIEELEPAEGERLLPALRRVTLAEEAPVSVPFLEVVAAAEAEPAPVAAEPDPVIPEPVPETPEPVAIAGDPEPMEEPPVEEDAGDSGAITEADEIAPPPAVDTGDGTEPEIVAGPVSKHEPDEGPETEATRASDEDEASDEAEAEEVADEPPPAARRPPPTRLYKGPGRSRSRTAHHVMGDRVYIASINGIPHDIGPFGSTLAGIRLPTDAFRTGGVELKPGRYRLEIAWHGPQITRRRTYFGTHEFDVELEGGLTYTVSGMKDREDVLGWDPKVGKAPRETSN